MTGIKYWGRIALCALIILLTIWIAAKAQDRSRSRLETQAVSEGRDPGRQIYSAIEAICDTGNGVMIYISGYGLAAVPNGCQKR